MTDMSTPTEPTRVHIHQGTPIRLRLDDGPGKTYLALPQEDGSIRLEPVAPPEPEPVYPRYGRAVAVRMGRLGSSGVIGGLPGLTYRVWHAERYRSVADPRDVEVWVDGDDTMHAGVYGPKDGSRPRQYADVDEGPRPGWLSVILDDAVTRLGSDL